VRESDPKRAPFLGTAATRPYSERLSGTVEVAREAMRVERERAVALSPTNLTHQLEVVAGWLDREGVAIQRRATDYEHRDQNEQELPQSGQRAGLS
jgi:hypothetical protein